MENLTEMHTTIRLPFQVNEESFYIKDNQLRKGIIWRVDAEVTEKDVRYRIWFRLENNKFELINYEHTFATKEQAIEYFTELLK